MPANPSRKPIIDLVVSFELPAIKAITTSQSGNTAPMMAPNPLEIYFTPQVEKLLLRKKFRKLKVRIGHHSFPHGNARPLAIKNAI